MSGRLGGGGELGQSSALYLTSRYSWEGLAGRIDNCRLEEKDPTEVAFMEEKHRDVMNVMQREDNVEHFLGFLETEYHPLGHMLVASACGHDGGHGVMAFSEVSAR